jgi:hypothetical protein
MYQQPVPEGVQGRHNAGAIHDGPHNLLHLNERVNRRPSWLIGHVRRQAESCLGSGWGQLGWGGSMGPRRTQVLYLQKSSGGFEATHGNQAGHEAQHVALRDVGHGMGLSHSNQQGTREGPQGHNGTRSSQYDHQGPLQQDAHTAQVTLSKRLGASKIQKWASAKLEAQDNSRQEQRLCSGRFSGVERCTGAAATPATPGSRMRPTSPG